MENLNNFVASILSADTGLSETGILYYIKLLKSDSNFTAKSDIISEFEEYDSQENFSWCEYLSSPETYVDEFASEIEARQFLKTYIDMLR